MAITLPDPNACCTPCESPVTVQVPGPQGIAGADGADGTDGVSPFTTFTALFTIPAELASAVATVADTSWMVIGEKVYGSRVDGSVHAFFEVVAIGGATSVTLKNLEDAATFMYLENSAPATTLNIGSLLIPAGIQGPSGTLTGAIPAGSQLKGNYSGAGPQLEIPNAKGASIWGNGTDAVEVPAGTNGHMLAYDSTDAEGVKSFKALPVTGDTDLADNRVLRSDGATGLPTPAQPSRVTITDAGAIRADGSGGNARGTDAVDLQLTRGGATQVASGTQSVIAGGQNNTAATTGSVVAGGDGNSVSTNNRGAIVGGLNNSTTGLENFVGGGNSNAASNSHSTVCGGTNNEASGQESFVGGGSNNQATTGQSCVVAGENNLSAGDASSILGGEENIASGEASVIGGGSNNLASSTYSCILGGAQAVADKWGQVSQSSGSFAADGDAQVSEFVLRIATADATPTVLLLDGFTAGRVMVVPNNTSWIFRMMLVARRSTGTTSIYEAVGQIENTAGTVTATAVAVTEVNDGIGLPATPVAVTADAVNDALIITVTGVAANSIRWVAYVRVVECGF